MTAIAHAAYLVLFWASIALIWVSAAASVLHMRIGELEPAPWQRQVHRFEARWGALLFASTGLVAVVDARPVDAVIWLVVAIVASRAHCKSCHRDDDPPSGKWSLFDFFALVPSTRPVGA